MNGADETDWCLQKLGDMEELRFARETSETMAAKNSKTPCLVCNPADAHAGEYCEKHKEELHNLEHQFEALFRFRRTSRGKDHETYEILLQGECDACGRVFLTETDPDNLNLTLIVDHDVDLDTRMAEFETLGIRKTWGDHLREKIEHELVHSWYGNARACIDIFQSNIGSRRHWDIEPREEESDDEDFSAEPHTPSGGKHSVH
jgi:hypothetical protein